LIQEIQKNLFRVKIPMPGSPLGNLNAYIIRSSDRNLIIDTGLGINKCRDKMFSAIETLGIELSQTDIFITHYHIDHIGLVNELITENTTIYCHQKTWDFVTHSENFRESILFSQRHGFPKELLLKALKEHSWDQSEIKWKVADIKFMTENDSIRIGDYLLVCIATPGHAKDHLCLYEPNRQLFFSGDHILGDITPSVQCWAEDTNPLKDYLKSLEKTALMDISLVLTGHREFVTDHQKRIKDLVNHHKNRLAEILEILYNTRKTAYHISSKIKWSVNSGRWEDIPTLQQWFATLEVVAHLRFLEEEGKLKRNISDNFIYYEQFP